MCGTEKTPLMQPCLYSSELSELTIRYLVDHRPARAALSKIDPELA